MQSRKEGLDTVSKRKKLSEFSLEKCIYMSMGSHGGETVEQIIRRKQKEVWDCGWSLWAFSSPIASKIAAFCEGTQSMYVVMAVTGEAPSGKTVRAVNYHPMDEVYNKCKIPSQMLVTYSGKKAYALVVDEYYEIEPHDNIFMKSDYERQSYFNGVEILEMKVGEGKRTKGKEIAMVVKLKAPYVVVLGS